MGGEEQQALLGTDSVNVQLPAINVKSKGGMGSGCLESGWLKKGGRDYKRHQRTFFKQENGNQT